MNLSKSLDKAIRISEGTFLVEFCPTLLPLHILMNLLCGSALLYNDYCMSRLNYKHTASDMKQLQGRIFSLLRKANTLLGVFCVINT